MTEIHWTGSLTEARTQAEDRGRLLLTYLFAPG